MSEQSAQPAVKRSRRTSGGARSPRTKKTTTTVAKKTATTRSRTVKKAVTTRAGTGRSSGVKKRTTTTRATTKRTTTKRATTKRASKPRATASPAAPATEAVHAVSETIGAEPPAADAVSRRAPTRPATPVPALWRRVPVSLYIAGITSLSLLVGGIGVGISDAGMIDVQAVAEERQRTSQSAATDGESDTQTQAVPVQTSETRNVPRLRPAASPRPAAAPAVPVATSTATSGAAVDGADVATDQATTTAAEDRDADISDAPGGEADDLVVDESRADGEGVE